jgi:hypothetical protein
MWNQAEIYRRRRRVFAAGAGLAILLIIIIALSGGGGPLKHAPTTTTLPRSPVPLTYAPSDELQEPVAAASAAPIPGEDAVTLLGGLDAGGTATASIATVSTGVAKPVGELPVSLYGTAAVTIKKTEYLFGGREGTITTKGASGDIELGILAYPAAQANARVTEIAHLPQKNYGLSAAATATTAYIVGGDNGTQTLATILAWTPGPGTAKQVGSLPAGLRYAAVTAVGSDLVIAGGLLSDLKPSSRIFVFDTKTDKLRTLGHELPHALYAGCAATLGKLAYILGGTTAGGSQADTIYSVDPVSGTVANAGTMGVARSEAACATTASGTIYIAGGYDGVTIPYVGTLTAPSTTKTKTKKH